VKSDGVGTAVHGVVGRKLARDGVKTNGMVERILCEVGLSRSVGWQRPSQSMSYFSATSYRF
jgi:hypothetical protein